MVADIAWGETKQSVEVTGSFQKQLEATWLPLETPEMQGVPRLAKNHGPADGPSSISEHGAQCTAQGSRRCVISNSTKPNKTQNPF